MNNDRTSNPNIPPHTWKRPIGLGWENPYTVRYASNLDDGPWHGMPLVALGLGASGDRPVEISTFGTSTVENTFFRICPLVNSAFLKNLAARNKPMHYVLNRQQMAVYLLGNGILAKEVRQRIL